MEGEMKLRVKGCKACGHDTIQAERKVYIHRITEEVVTEILGYNTEDYITQRAWLCPVCGAYRIKKKQNEIYNNHLWNY